jgi:putative oxidoreductase
VSTDPYETSILSGVEDPAPPADLDRWHRGHDLGLLVLRIALAGVMGAHGLQHLFGLFHGPGVGGYSHVLGMLGFTKQTTLLSWITGITELGGSALVLLGLFTQLGVAGLLGIAASAVYVKAHGGFFEGQGQGFEFELLLAMVAFALLCTGSGRFALDVNTPWRRRPIAFGTFGFLLAAAAVVVVLVLFR